MKTFDETYTVRFWFTNENGLRKQETKDVSLKVYSEKNNHDKAETVIRTEYAGRCPTVISVTYA